MDTTNLTLLEDLVIGSARGRKPQQVQMAVVRELTPADLELLINPPAKGLVARPLSQMRTIHHNLARLFAQGTKQVEISAQTGYSQSYICTLQNDPAFQELIAYYSEQQDVAFVDFQQRLASFGLSCIEELQARLAENPDEIKWRELMEAATLFLDRSVTKDARAGGASGVNIKVEFVGKKDDSTIVDITPEAA